MYSQKFKNWLYIFSCNTASFIYYTADSRNGMHIIDSLYVCLSRVDDEEDDFYVDDQDVNRLIIVTQVRFQVVFCIASSV